VKDERPHARWVPFACVVWGVLIVAGMAMLWRYKSTPGNAATAPELWPASSQIARAPGRATVVMFAHPKCACTRASIDELAALTTNVSSQADIHVMFFKPPATPEGWENSDTRRRASELRGVAVRTDADGSESKRFGAKTSGETLVYDAVGKLVYHGGITSARGHAGDNAGRRRITELIMQGKTDKGSAPTFGCGLEETASEQSRSASASSHDRVPGGGAASASVEKKKDSVIEARAGQVQ
jgi:hypothetical protein